MSIIFVEDQGSFPMIKFNSGMYSFSLSGSFGL